MSPLLSCPIPVISFHRVLPYKTSLSVTVDEFDHYLKWFKSNGFHSLTAAEFGRALSGEEVAEHGFVITFDDGYRDNCYMASRLLEKHGMKAILFAITGRVMDENPKPPSAGWVEERGDCYLSWEEIKSMTDSGIFELHSHTHSHDRSWVTSASANIRRTVSADIATSLKT